MSRSRGHRRGQRALVAFLGLSALALLGTGYWIPVKAALAQQLLERAWRAERSGVSEARPWPWADTSPLARLAIPSLEASWVVLSGASGRNLAFAPAQVDGTAQPGQAGVTVIAGHRDTHFRLLERVEIGMEIGLEDTRGRVHSYRVVSTEIVDATRSRLRLDAPVPLLVLTTCYPFDALTAGGPLRYVITAEAD